MLTKTQDTPTPKLVKPNINPINKAFLTVCSCNKKNSIAILRIARPGRWNGARPKGKRIPAKKTGSK
jgi:hypothetical protein